MAVEQDLWERGFQLAYFLFPDRNTALRILTGALNKLRVQRGRETRRSYWRDKHLKRGITRITRNENDALQWLIFAESDPVEKQQEDEDAAVPAQMVVRYIKNLVRMTTSMSSFYVNIGLHRLLFNYSTAETQRVYESVTERFLGADEYRRAKSALMKKLLQRFEMLKTCRTQHGELRFETLIYETDEAQEVWARLVDTCLTAFTPWSTLQACPVPVNYDASRDNVPSGLSGHGSEKVDFNQVEINRCHAFIDPVCDSRLMMALLLQPPMEKLALPRFYMENERNEDNPTHPGGTTELTPAEREDIGKQLSGQASRRKQADPQLVSIVVDGEARAQFRLESGGNHTFQLEEGDQLIEVRTQLAGEDLLLAVHALAYTESRGLDASQETFQCGRFCNLELSVMPEGKLGDEPGHATVTIRFKPKSIPWASAVFGRHTRERVPRLAVFGAAMVVVVAMVVSRLAFVRQHNLPFNTPAIVQNSPGPSTSPNPSPTATPLPQLAMAHVEYRLVPDEMATRGAGSGETEIVLPGKPAVIDLELPLPAGYAQGKLRATLKLFFSAGEIVSKGNLHPKRSKAGLVVTFAIPSEKLTVGEDYLVELQSDDQGRKMETVEAYGFRVNRNH